MGVTLDLSGAYGTACEAAHKKFRPLNLDLDAESTSVLSTLGERNDLRSSLVRHLFRDFDSTVEALRHRHLVSYEEAVMDEIVDHSSDDEEPDDAAIWLPKAYETRFRAALRAAVEELVRQTRAVDVESARNQTPQAGPYTILEDAWSKGPKITVAEKNRLADLTGLTARQVSVWFANQRQRRARTVSSSSESEPYGKVEVDSPRSKKRKRTVGLGERDYASRKSAKKEIERSSRMQVPIPEGITSTASISSANAPTRCEDKHLLTSDGSRIFEGRTNSVPVRGILENGLAASSSPISSDAPSPCTSLRLCFSSSSLSSYSTTSFDSSTTEDSTYSHSSVCLSDSAFGNGFVDSSITRPQSPSESSSFFQLDDSSWDETACNSAFKSGVGEGSLFAGDSFWESILVSTVLFAPWEDAAKGEGIAGARDFLKDFGTTLPLTNTDSIITAI